MDNSTHCRLGRGEVVEGDVGETCVATPRQLTAAAAFSTGVAAAVAFSIGVAAVSHELPGVIG